MEENVIKVIIFIVVFTIIAIGNLAAFIKKRGGGPGEKTGVFDLEQFLKNLSRGQNNTPAQNQRTPAAGQEFQSPLPRETEEYPEDMPEDAKEFFRSLEHEEYEQDEEEVRENEDIFENLTDDYAANYSEYETAEGADVPDLPAARVQPEPRHADDYGEFIRDNGKQAIVLNEILGPPKALRE